MVGNILKDLWVVLKDVLMITGFVFMMMLVIEYANVQTRGQWQKLLTGKKWRQYLFAALMGILPGCLGSFAVVTLYTHNIISLGALVTTMIATSGDEAFVMLALFPVKAILLNVILFGIGIGAGVLTDLLLKKHRVRYASFHELPLHEETCTCFRPRQIIPQLRDCSLPRFLLMLFLLLCLVGFVTGIIGENEWSWIRVTLVLVSTVSLFIVSTVPEHFLREHLWKHVAIKHVPQIFFWTLGAMLVIKIFLANLTIEQWLQQSRYIVLIIACLVGLIPESGPHLVFVTMYAQHLIPFSILLASSIVQDGHGMLPLLAQSRREFGLVKLLNFLVGISIGLLGLWMKV